MFLLSLCRQLVDYVAGLHADICFYAHNVARPRGAHRQGFDNYRINFLNDIRLLAFYLDGIAERNFFLKLQCHYPDAYIIIVNRTEFELHVTTSPSINSSLPCGLS